MSYFIVYSWAFHTAYNVTSPPSSDVKLITLSFSPFVVFPTSPNVYSTSASEVHTASATALDVVQPICVQPVNVYESELINSDVTPSLVGSQLEQVYDESEHT